MDVQECFQVPPAELVPHQTFEKLLPLINLHERSLFGIILVQLFMLCPRPSVLLWLLCAFGIFFVLLFKRNNGSGEFMYNAVCTLSCLIN